MRGKRENNPWVERELAGILTTSLEPGSLAGNGAKSHIPPPVLASSHHSAPLGIFVSVAPCQIFKRSLAV